MRLQLRLLAVTGLVAGGVFLGVAESGAPIPLVEAASCTPGSPTAPFRTDIFPGSCWLAGQGVNVYSNGTVGGSGQYQCVDLVVRLYQARGWITGSWPTIQYGDQMWDIHPANLSDQANGQITYLNPGDAVSMEVREPSGQLETGGHVAVINTETPTGGGIFALQLVNQNAASVLTTGTWNANDDTITLAASGGWTYPVDGVVHAPVAAPPLVGIDSSGTVLVKEGGLSAPWTTEYGGVSQIAVASAPTNGPLIAVLTSAGTVLAKEGGLSAPWTTEYGEVSQIAVASDPTNGPLLAVLTTAGTVLAKEGGLSAPWTTEYGGVSQIAVASAPTNGPLIAVLTSAGTVLAKEGGLSAPWTTEYGGVSQIAVASDPTNGALIAVLTSDGTVLAKEGGLSAPWTTEYGGVSQVAVASAPTYGPLVAILSGGTALAKEGGLSSSWTTEYSAVSQIGVAG
jgi:hypothetical protein